LASIRESFVAASNVSGTHCMLAKVGKVCGYLDLHSIGMVASQQMVVLAVAQHKT
jgi:hypothetical protein